MRHPLQLYALAGVLQSLELRGCGVGLESGSLPVVSRLTALTALRLNHFSNLPQTLLTALPALHRLQNLQLVRLRESGTRVAGGTSRAQAPTEGRLCSTAPI